jgi:hypothetical protein
MAPTPTTPIRIEGPALARHAASEWVLSNALGGFAMGTVSGVPMRRYHGLLVAATRPPLGRVAALMAVDDAVLFEGEREREPRSVPLTAFQFVGNPPAAASPHLTAFEHDAGACRWEFSIPQASIPPRGCPRRSWWRRAAMRRSFDTRSMGRRAGPGFACARWWPCGTSIAWSMRAAG